MKKIHCGTINPNTLKIAGKPNRVMTPEVKVAAIWADRKNDYRRHKENKKIRHYFDDTKNGGFSYFEPISGVVYPMSQGTVP